MKDSIEYQFELGKDLNVAFDFWEESRGLN